MTTMLYGWDMGKGYAINSKVFTIRFEHAALCMCDSPLPCGCGDDEAFYQQHAPIDVTDHMTDDTALNLAAWNAKVDALIADIGAYHDTITD